MRAERIFLYAVVFLCGAAVLVVELISARHLSPFYGTTLSVWTAVISVTLAALALGYLAGGWWGDRLEARGQALWGLACILAFAAIGCALLPVLGPPIMRAMLPAGLVGGVLLSTLGMLLPTLAALGMVGPLVIRRLTRDVEHAGRIAGRMFALSTLGSILAALATGFVLAPLCGVRGSYLATACVLAALAVGAAVLSRRSTAATAAGAVLVLAALGCGAGTLHRPTPIRLGDATILAIDDRSPYGEIKIVERPTSHGVERFLLSNGIYQTGVYRQTNTSSLRYAHVLASGLSILPEGSKIVVLGVGGGVLPKLLNEMGYRVTAVDIDPRTERIAREWFGLPDAVDIVLADARQYLAGLPPASVDAIVLDACTGDREPVHLMTVEALAECRRALKPDGLLAMNLLMYARGTQGMVYAGLIATLREAGFAPEGVGTKRAEEFRNTLVFAHADGRPWKKAFRRAPLLKLGVERGGIVLRDYYLALQNPVPPPATDFPVVYTDDRSSLDFLNETWSHRLRRQVLERLSPELVCY